MKSITALLVLAFAAVVSAQATSDKRLTTTDVEKVSGVTGVKLVPRGSQVGAGGDLNFARPDGKLLLMVNFGPAALYMKAKTQKEIEVGGQKYPMELFAHAVPGVGDEAFASPPGKVQYVIYARKGNNAITVSTYYPPGGGEAAKPLLTEAQLKQVAQIIFSRE
jgi:hypothetical protein